MSWQEYVENQLIAKGIRKAGIIGLKGGVWAAHDYSEADKANELSTPGHTTLRSVFSDSEAESDQAVQAIQASGLWIAGKKYFYTGPSEPTHMVGKLGAGGCVIAKTKLAVLVAEYDAPLQAPEAVKIVLDLANWLIASNC
ncbi:profilin [Mycena polygramma]|nr:profilin [Mycena polygramma]